MNHGWKILLGILICGGFGVSLHNQFPVAQVAPAPTVAPIPTFTRKSLPQAELAIVTVPPGSLSQVTVIQSKTTESVQQFAKRTQALAVLNAGFFDPVNQKTTSYVAIAGKPVADPTQNERLTQNPKLQPYLKQIFNRSEFRRYQCGGNVQFAIAQRSAPIPQTCELVDAVGGGPQLLPEMTAIAEGFVDPDNDRDVIGINQRNSRSAIGIKPDGTILLVMAAQKPEGVTIPELAAAMKQLGVRESLNLDGGTSSALVYRDQVLYGKVKDESRPVKSVLVVK